LRNKWAANVGYKLEVVLTSGAFVLYLNEKTYASAVPGGGAASNLVAGTRHKILAVPTVGASTTTVSFYLDDHLLSTTEAQANEDVTNTQDMYTGGTSAARYAMTVFDTYDFNYAHTADQAKDLFRNGIAEADKWGSQTAVYTSNFSAGVDSWAGQSGLTLTGNTDGINGSDDWLKVERTGAAGRGDINRATGFVADKRCHAAITIYNDVSSTIAYFKVCHYNSSYISTPIAIPAGTEVTTTAYVLSAGAGASIYIYPCLSDGTSVNSVATGTIYYVKNMITYESGATLALESDNAQPIPGMWLDSSTNNLHAIYPAAGASLTRPKDSFVIRWVNTWAASHEAQYLGGINQAMLPPKCCITSIVGVIAGSTIEDIILGDGSDTDHWVAITSGLAAGTVNFTIANAFSNLTNYKLVVDPDANFTGSITWTIRGYIYQ
jgi:hypothetical protein